MEDLLKALEEVRNRKIKRKSNKKKKPKPKKKEDKNFFGSAELISAVNKKKEELDKIN